MFVVDASVVLAWCFEDEASDDADRVLSRLEHEPAIAPAHWPLDVANAIRTAERRGRIDASELPRLRTLLAALPIEIAPVDLATATGTVIDTALRYDLTASDAAYLDLAAARGLALATIDASLRTACARAGIERVA
jgi:predicted nucleic acid-binding protein